jgi:hypothetical protein
MAICVGWNLDQRGGMRMRHCSHQVYMGRAVHLYAAALRTGVLELRSMSWRVPHHGMDGVTVPLTLADISAQCGGRPKTNYEAVEFPC